MVITSLLLPSFVFLTLYPLPPLVKDSRRILILLHLILLLLPSSPSYNFLALPLAPPPALPCTSS